MRISDWSSDVCSSDLRRPDIDRLAVAPRIGERLDAVVAPVPHARGDIDILGQAIAADDIDGGRFAGSGDAIGGSARVAGAVHPKLGRASCRERVCQYV